MKTYCRLAALVAVLWNTPFGFGAALDQVGPDQDAQAQRGWPAGIAKILRHETRVYSIWVNGNESFFFRAGLDETAELIKLFSEMPMRDHRVFIKRGKKELRSFREDKIEANVELHVLDGIALASMRDEEAPVTFEPTLTIHVDPAADEVLLKRNLIEDHVILKSEILGWSEGKTREPIGKKWYAAVQFKDGTPAIDFEKDVETAVTMWRMDEKRGIPVGEVDSNGLFMAAFSAAEMEDLRAAKTWLTLTVTLGPDHRAPRGDDLLLQVEKLVLDPDGAEPIRVRRPKKG